MSNAMDARTLGSIALGQIHNGVGTCKFFSLHTGKVFTANHFTVLPMTNLVVEHLNKMARKDLKPPAREPVFRLHGTDLSDSPPSVKLDDFSPKELTQGPPITVPVDETDEDNSPIELTDALPEVLDESTHHILRSDKPIRGVEESTVEEQREHIHVQYDERTHNDNIDEEMPELIDDSEEKDIPKTTTYQLPPRTRRAPDRLNLSCTEDTDKGHLLSYHMTARRAVKEIPTIARPAIIEELTNLTKKGLLTGPHWVDLTPTQRSRILRSHTNVTHKVTPASDGTGRTTDKVKARHVANGDGQDRNHYSREETSLPTLSISGLYLSLITNMHNFSSCICVAADVGCAYLNAKMLKHDPEKLVFIKIDPDIATLLVQVDSNMLLFVRKDGSIIAELNKALYGCIESAVLWYEELSQTLISLGLTRNDTDPCVFNLSGNKRLTVTVYVDDLMIMSNNVRTIDWLLTELTRKYEQLKITRGTTHNYLGMVFDISQPPLIMINQQGMIEDIISSTRTNVMSATNTDSNIRSKVPPKTPAPTYLFDINVDSDLLPESLKIIFHSTVAKLIYISTRTRQDLLTTISFLSKRVSNPTQEDWRKLQRALNYLDNTKTQRLRLGMTTPMTIRTYIDASFAVHSDFKSHTGICITMGIGWFYAKSTGQKINTTSSCQAELVALAKGFQQSIYSAYFLASQGYNIPPIVVNQDNQSTITLISNGKSNSELTRHIQIGYYWVKGLIDRGLIRIEYCPTEFMRADFFTKPLQGTLFNQMREKVAGISPV